MAAGGSPFHRDWISDAVNMESEVTVTIVLSSS